MVDYLFGHYCTPDTETPQAIDITCGVHRIKMWHDDDAMSLIINDAPDVGYWKVDEFWPLDVLPVQTKDEIWGRTDVDGSQEFILVSWNFDAKLVHVYDGVEK